MIMKDIYAGDSNALVWFGKPGSPTELTFDILQRFGAADGTQDGMLGGLGGATHQDILPSADKRRAATELFI